MVFKGHCHKIQDSDFRLLTSLLQHIYSSKVDAPMKLYFKIIAECKPDKLGQSCQYLFHFSIYNSWQIGLKYRHISYETTTIPQYWTSKLCSVICQCSFISIWSFKSVIRYYYFFKFVHDRVQDAVHSTGVHLVLMKRYYDEIQCPNVLELIWWYHWEFRQKLHLKLLWCQKDL